MAYREVTDSGGVCWKVWDTYPQSRALKSLPSSHVEGWLSFESPEEKRRIVPVPREWISCSDDSLLDLMRQAEPVRTRGMAGLSDFPLPYP